jgi:hypothetical protein
MKEVELPRYNASHRYIIVQKHPPMAKTPTKSSLTEVRRPVLMLARRAHAKVVWNHLTADMCTIQLDYELRQIVSQIERQEGRIPWGEVRKRLGSDASQRALQSRFEKKSHYV